MSAPGITFVYGAYAHWQSMVSGHLISPKWMSPGSMYIVYVSVHTVLYDTGCIGIFTYSALLFL
jgi:hypothetical protein